MRFLLSRAAALLVVTFLCGPSRPLAEPAPDPQSFDRQAFAWAYGRVVDSITVVGNRKVRDFAILREMESRVGEPLDADALERDERYIRDLSVFVSVTISVEPIADDRCALRVVVTERPTLLLKLVYPVFEYDINTQRFEYGLKWSDRNFRKRLESFSVDAVRDTHDDASASISWNTRWVGWKHLGVGARASYFNRAGEPTRLTIVEQTRFGSAVSVPLSESRIAFSQILTGLSVANNRLGEMGAPPQRELLLTPSLGYWYDRRDSPLRPRRGDYFFINVQSTRVMNGEGSTYHLLANDVRLYRPLDEWTVIALLSRLDYQFGRYPEYTRFNMGGAGTLRGYEGSDFQGAHRWYQTAEIRISPWPTRYVRLPLAGLSDFSLAIVAFVDTGIAWSNEQEFSVSNFHAGVGWGLRLYSPFQDVARFDLGYNSRGGIRPYFSTGVRF
jgi:outer membrane protein insertion porin family